MEYYFPYFIDEKTEATCPKLSLKSGGAGRSPKFCSGVFVFSSGLNRWGLNMFVCMHDDCACIHDGCVYIIIVCS